jgi:hypothetical protein
MYYGDLLREHRALDTMDMKASLFNVSVPSTPKRRVRRRLQMPLEPLPGIAEELNDQDIGTMASVNAATAENPPELGILEQFEAEGSVSAPSVPATPFQDQSIEVARDHRGETPVPDMGEPSFNLDFGMNEAMC